MNQLNAQIKLLDIWKALNVDGYPLKIKQQQAVNNHGTLTRAWAIGRPCEIGKSTLTQNTCPSDAIKLWNQLPPSITTSKNVYHAK